MRQEGDSVSFGSAERRIPLHLTDTVHGTRPVPCSLSVRRKRSFSFDRLSPAAVSAPGVRALWRILGRFSGWRPSEFTSATPHRTRRAGPGRLSEGRAPLSRRDPARARGARACPAPRKHQIVWGQMSPTSRVEPPNEVLARSRHFRRRTVSPRDPTQIDASLRGDETVQVLSNLKFSSDPRPQHESHRLSRRRRRARAGRDAHNGLPGRVPKRRAWNASVALAGAAGLALR